jgi:hypothetical protein
MEISNKFQLTLQIIEDIKYVNFQCLQQLTNFFYYSTSILIYKHAHANITNIQYPTNFHTIQTKPQDCTPSFEQKKNKLIKLCARNYVTFDNFTIEQRLNLQIHNNILLKSNNMDKFSKSKDSINSKRESIRMCVCVCVCVCVA